MQVNKHYKTLPVAANDDDIADVDLLRSRVAFGLSRSRLGCCLIRYAIRSVNEGLVTLEDLGSQISKGPVRLGR